MNKRIKGVGQSKLQNRLPLYMLFKESAVQNVMCEEVMNYIGASSNKKKSKSNIPAPKQTKDITITEEESRPKSLKDQIIASLILILTANDLPSILNQLNQIKL